MDKKKQTHDYMHCFHCRKNLTDEDCHMVFMQDKKISVCLDCFSAKYPLTEFKDRPRQNSIAYVAVNKETTNVFTKDWDLNDEALLLGCINSLGVGNWNDIAKRIPNHDPVDIQTHYTNIYLKSKTAPLAIFPDEDKIPETFPKPPVPEYTTEAQSSNPELPNHNRYMPKRHEFGEEFIDNAEELVSGLTFSYSDDKNSFKKKINQLNLYNNHLEERVIRTKVLEDFQLIENNTPNLGGMTESQMAKDKTMFLFAPYLDKKYLKDNINKMHQSEAIFSQIQNCHKYLAEGVKTFQEGKLVDNLEKCVHNGEISEVEIWNHYISLLEQRQVDTFPDDLSNDEHQFIETNRIPIPKYMALKDLIIREFSVDQNLTLKDAIALSPEYEEDIKNIYEFFKDQGWVY
ncbi:hypothetical protein TVAG_164270 [Trichomonas vaginalis G3]|uniref:Myb-like domain-containing protein n=1 Tax=Trichomonas vaginalis (strain ATCC PRA-98 / G3) TaxID=412133 RepID=A2E1W8_TRIV3|nr:positive regulation of histone acetylation [Trichomonas vaginalis G3]EAY13317.1 hypothetical protein TVAG_164270 [Trichomonas vaginalis G3]KAI5540417.1 positive regulation of histone acetylation [Trichomonas vaginalis G3]|eukprot:XP_001325540.1 hypothetical protein [Trichomonas vaginalis G3]